VVRYLLEHTLLFLSIQNGSFCQISGPTLASLVTPPLTSTSFSSSSSKPAVSFTIIPPPFLPRVPPASLLPPLPFDSWADPLLLQGLRHQQQQAEADDDDDVLSQHFADSPPLTPMETEDALSPPKARESGPPEPAGYDNNIRDPNSKKRSQAQDLPNDEHQAKKRKQSVTEFTERRQGHGNPKAKKRKKTRKTKKNKDKEIKETRNRAPAVTAG